MNIPDIRYTVHQMVVIPPKSKKRWFTGADFEENSEQANIKQKDQVTRILSPRILSTDNWRVTVPLPRWIILNPLHLFLNLLLQFDHLYQNPQALPSSCLLSKEANPSKEKNQKVLNLSTEHQTMREKYHGRSSSNRLRRCSQS